MMEIKFSDINVPAFLRGKNVYFNQLATTYLEREAERYYRLISRQIKKRKYGVK